MRKVLVYSGIGMAAASLLGGGGYYAMGWYEKSQQPESSLSSVAEKSQEGLFADKSPLKAGGGDAGSAIGGSLSASNPQGSGNLLTQGNSTGSNSTGSQSSEPKILSPEEFVAYDQYKDKEAALYQELKIGDGLEAGVNMKLTVNYRGWLTDGRKFDDSYIKGKPFTFVLGGHQVIPGWEQGTFGMKVGGKRRLIVPPAVGYGAEGKDPIPGNSVLVFDIELLKVEQ